MIKTSSKLEELLQTGVAYLSQASELELSKRPNPQKWSKKEILGHLIDSGINNLQRFTEIPFESQPYQYRPYNQAGLVTSNAYQQADSKELINFWAAINTRIGKVIQLQTEKTLAYTIKVDEETSFDLRFLMEDYVVHLEHHLKQILAQVEV